MKIEISGDTISDIVVQELKGYHEIMKDDPEEDGICVAIEVVLSHYLNRDDYITWYKDVYGIKQMTNIRNECSFLKPEDIAKIEDAYDAKYVFESCIKDRDGGWCNWPCAIFYAEEAHPRGSNYFGVYVNESGDFMITNGISATEPFDGLQVGNDVIYSRYRHDYREYKGYMVDGGRDYFRRSSDGTPVKLQVVGDHLEMIK